MMVLGALPSLSRTDANHPCVFDRQGFALKALIAAFVHRLCHRFVVAVLAALGATTTVWAQPYTVHDNGTVTDAATGLTWDRCVLGRTGPTCTGSLVRLSWVDALIEVTQRNRANHLGFSDWRLPNVNEIESLVNINAAYPAIDTTAFPNTPMSPSVWSSTTTPNPNAAWRISFDDGTFFQGSKDRSSVSQRSAVRLVRGGQAHASFDTWLPVAGVCGSAHSTNPVVTAPSAGLCLPGTPSGVTTSAANFTWTCDGFNGGAANSCSATRGYTVTPSAGANGSISPGTPQVVAFNATRAFTVTPDSGFSASVAGSCGGSLNSGEYSTNAVTTDCTVSATFYDSAPEPFGFTPLTGVATGTVVMSAAFSVMGIAGPSAISITGGEYKVNGGNFTNTPGTVVAGDTVTVRHTSSAAGSSLTTTTLTIGGITASFESTTGAPVFGQCGSASSAALRLAAPSADLCAAGVATGVSTSAADFSWTCNGLNTGMASGTCTASRGYTVTPSAGANGSISPSTPQVVAFNATRAFTVTPDSGFSASVAGSCGGSLNSGEYSTNAVTTDCTVSATFYDSAPEPFGFTPLTGVATGTVVMSAAFSVMGIAGPSAISITGGEYKVNGGNFTNTPGTVVAGDTVTVRHTSSAAGSSLTTTTLTIGGITASFESTTGAPVFGQCGSASSAALRLAAPSADLCAAGVATGVSTSAADFSWTCNGLNTGMASGTCTASRGYTVTPSAGANGSISPSTPQVVAFNATRAFTVTPNVGLDANVSGCGGTLTGTTFTTAAITADCTVAASFVDNSVPVALSVPSAGGSVSPSPGTTLIIAPPAGGASGPPTVITLPPPTPNGAPITLQFPSGVVVQIRATSLDATLSVINLLIGNTLVPVIEVRGGSVAISGSTVQGPQLLVGGTLLSSAGNTCPGAPQLQVVTTTAGSRTLAVTGPSGCALSFGPSTLGRASPSTSGTLRPGQLAEFDSDGRLARVRLGSIDGKGELSGDPQALVNRFFGTADLNTQAWVSRVDKPAPGSTTAVLNTLIAGLPPEVQSALRYRGTDFVSGVLRFVNTDNASIDLVAWPLGVITVSPGSASASLDVDGTALIQQDGLGLRLAPAPNDLGDLTNRITQAGGKVTLQANGILRIQLTANAAPLVVRPDWWAPTATTPAGVVQDTNGITHTAQSGRSQRLNGAAADTQALLNLLKASDAQAAIATQANAALQVTLNGLRYTLAPQAQVIAMPTAQAGRPWWISGGTLYLPLTEADGSTPKWAQGFGLR